MSDLAFRPRGRQIAPGPEAPYDRRRLSYAGTFDHRGRAATIRAMEWATGKLRLLRRIRRFEGAGVPVGAPFFGAALEVMGIDVDTPGAQLRHIPETGPVVVVANHPHGLVDGLVLGALVARIRGDFRILTRSLLAGVPEVADHVIAVPFPHEEQARDGNLAMRRAAMACLAAGGVIVVFPAGAVATSRTAFGPAVEHPWHPFTAKMIRQSAATVVPVRFAGQNSRAYQVASLVSPVLRQGLLLHEVVHALDRPQAPVIRPAIPPAEWRARAVNGSGFTDWLRERTIDG